MFTDQPPERGEVLIDGGEPALAGPGATYITDATRFQLDDVTRVGPDVRFTATPLRWRVQPPRGPSSAWTDDPAVVMMSLLGPVRA